MATAAMIPIVLRAIAGGVRNGVCVVAMLQAVQERTNGPFRARVMGLGGASALPTWVSGIWMGGVIGS